MKELIAKNLLPRNFSKMLSKELGYTARFIAMVREGSRKNEKVKEALFKLAKETAQKAKFEEMLIQDQIKQIQSIYKEIEDLGLVKIEADTAGVLI